MPRAKPRRGWKKPVHATRRLTAGQRDRLSGIGLPKAALPAVEQIALYAIIQSEGNLPRGAEMRAAMGIVRKKVLALQSALAETDEWTLGKIDVAGSWDRPVVKSAAAELSRLTKAVDSADRRLAAKNKPRPSLFALDVALRLRDVFEVFDIRFDRSRRSLASETLYVILNFVSPTGLDAADHYVREAEKLGD